MNGLPYYKAYPRDFFEGTIGMAFEMKGAYRLILDLIYMQNGNLPDDARYISGLLGCSIRKWKSIRNQLVQMGKLGVSGEFLTNYRAVSELETLSKLQEKKRENRAGHNKNKDLQKRPSDHLRDYTEPEPDKKETPKGVPKKKTERGTRLSKDWEASQADRQYAIDHDLTQQAINLESEKFKNYWTAKSGSGATKLDWPATWRNWVLTAQSRMPRGSPAKPKPGSLMGALNDFINEGDGHGQENERGIGGDVVMLPSPTGHGPPGGTQAIRARIGRVS